MKTFLLFILSILSAGPALFAAPAAAPQEADRVVVQPEARTGIQPDNYRLALSLKRQKNESAPFIRLGTGLPADGGWYRLGTVVIEND